MFETRTAFEVDFDSVRWAVGGGSYVRGSKSRWREAVHGISWDPVQAELRGTVDGEGGNRYRAVANFKLGTWPARYESSSCSCLAMVRISLSVKRLRGAFPASTGRISQPMSASFSR